MRIAEAQQPAYRTLISPKQGWPLMTGQAAAVGQELPPWALDCTFACERALLELTKSALHHARRSVHPRPQLNKIRTRVCTQTERGHAVPKHADLLQMQNLVLPCEKLGHH